MTRPQLIINLHGGFVHDVFCSVPDMQVLVVDWDLASSFPGEPGLVDVTLDDGPAQACVSDVSVGSLHELAGTDMRPPSKRPGPRSAL